MFGLMSLEEQMLFRNSFFILIALSTAILSCSKGYLNTENQLFKIIGNAQGTTYTIQVVDSSLHVSKFQIDSLLFAFDEKLSTYKANSLISRFNQVSFKQKNNKLVLHYNKFLNKSVKIGSQQSEVHVKFLALS